MTSKWWVWCFKKMDCPPQNAKQSWIFCLEFWPCYLGKSPLNLHWGFSNYMICSLNHLKQIPIVQAWELYIVICQVKSWTLMSFDLIRFLYQPDVQNDIPNFSILLHPPTPQCKNWEITKLYNWVLLWCAKSASSGEIFPTAILPTVSFRIFRIFRIFHLEGSQGFECSAWEWIKEQIRGIYGWI